MFNYAVLIVDKTWQKMKFKLKLMMILVLILNQVDFASLMHMNKLVIIE